MGRPPALPGDAQSLTVPGICESLPSVNRSRRGVTDREAFNGRRSEFKPYGVELQGYHVVWIPKYRRKVVYGELRRHLGEVFRELALQKESKVVEGHLLP